MAEELLEIDGLNMRTEAYNAATRSGRYSMPPMRGENLALPGRSGSVPVLNRPLEPGVGALAVWVTGRNPDGTFPSSPAALRAQFESNMGLIQRLFTRPYKLSTIRAGVPNSASVRRAFVQWVEFDEPEVQAGGTRAEFSIGYEIPGVFWEDETSTVQSSTANATLPKTFDLTSFAAMTGFIEDAVIDVIGPITNPRVTDSETGAYVELTGLVSAGQTWTVDVGAATSMRAGLSVLSSTKHAGGYRLLTIPNTFGLTSTPRLVLSGTSGGVTTQLRVTARKKWVSA